MEEVWKDIAGYEGYYQVSNFGNVRALERTILKSNGIVYVRKAREMAKTLNTDGYPTVKLSKNDKGERIAVHRLVALAFIPNPNRLPEINHIDFNRQNARVDNLEWVSHKDNILYTINAGRHFCNSDLTGENNPNYKNTTLKEFYASHPEERKKLSRKGSQNGRATPIALEYCDGTRLLFGFIRECADYLINHNLSKSNKRDVVADNIVRAINNNSTYCNCHFSRV